MKKKSCLVLALILVMVQMISLFAALPASATTMSSKNYNLLKASEAITIDGKADEAVWENADWSDQFVKASNSGGELGDFKAKFKALWSPVEGDDSKMDIYILIVAEGHTVPTNWANCMRVYIRTSDDSKSFWTGMKKLDDIINNSSKPNMYGGTSSSDVNAIVQLGAVNDIANSGTATYEFCYRMDKADSIKFEVSALAALNGVQISGSWCGGDANTGDILGTGRILQTSEKDEVDENADVLFLYGGSVVASQNKSANNTVTLPDYELFGTMLGWADAAGNLYPVGGTYTVTDSTQVRLTAVALQVTDYELLAGACALIEKPTAIRFEVKENPQALAALGTAVQEKGVIIVETSLLTDAILADGTFSAEELTAAGIAFDKIVFTTAEDNVYSAVKNNITDVNVSYSAVSYLSVKYADNSVQNITSNYSEALNARSVKAISEAAYADRANVRAEIEGVNYKFKISKDYGVEGFTLFSYSPYTEEQLDLLAEFKK